MMNNELIQKKLVFTQEGAMNIPEKTEPYLWGLAQKKWAGNESTTGLYASPALTEKPAREIHVLPFFFSCRESSEILVYKPMGNENLSLSPELVDILFRKAIIDDVLNRGVYSWIPECGAVLYTGERVYAPGY